MLSDELRISAIPQSNVHGLSIGLQSTKAEISQHCKSQTSFAKTCLLHRMAHSHVTGPSYSCPIGHHLSRRISDEGKASPFCDNDLHTYAYVDCILWQQFYCNTCFGPTVERLQEPHWSNESPPRDIHRKFQSGFWFRIILEF